MWTWWDNVMSLASVFLRHAREALVDVPPSAVPTWSGGAGDPKHTPALSWGAVVFLVPNTGQLVYHLHKSMLRNGPAPCFTPKPRSETPDHAPIDVRFGASRVAQSLSIQILVLAQWVISGSWD